MLTHVKLYEWMYYCIPVWIRILNWKTRRKDNIKVNTKLALWSWPHFQFSIYLMTFYKWMLQIISPCRWLRQPWKPCTYRIFVLYFNQKHYYTALLAEKVSWMKTLISGQMHIKPLASRLTLKSCFLKKKKKEQKDLLQLNKLKVELTALKKKANILKTFYL